jgi:hypothetical protein
MLIAGMEDLQKNFLNFKKWFYYAINICFYRKINQMEGEYANRGMG